MTTTSKTTASKNVVFDRYIELADSFGSVVEALPRDAWNAPSACEDWTGRDVLAHVVGTLDALHGLVPDGRYRVTPLLRSLAERDGSFFEQGE